MKLWLCLDGLEVPRIQGDHTHPGLPGIPGVET